MTVTGLKKHQNTYTELYIDDNYIGPVYASDIRNFSLQEDKEVTDEVYEKIRETLIRRAFNKAVKLLSVKEYCASEIAFKLKNKDYTEDITDEVICKLYDYNYLNDKRYAYAYFMGYMKKKSRQLIINELLMKGISVNTIEEAANEIYSDNSIDEEALIKEILEKRYRNADLNDEGTRRRIYSYMIRRGFYISTVKKYLT